MQKTAVVITGFAPAPTRQFVDDLRRVYPDREFEVHIVSWNNWHADALEAVFPHEQIHFFDFNEHEADIKATIQKFDFNYRKTKPINAASMFLSWKFARDVLEKIDAEYAIKLRVDNEILFSPHDSGFFDDYDGLTIPSGWNVFGGIFDQVCYGPKAHVERYLDLYSDMETYASQGHVLHPERLLRVHLQAHLPNRVRRMPMAVYLRGDISPDTVYREIDEPMFDFDLSGPELWRILASERAYHCREGVDSPAQIRRKRLPYKVLHQLWRYWRIMQLPFKS